MDKQYPYYQFLNLPEIPEELQEKFRKSVVERVAELRADPSIKTNDDDQGHAYERNKFVKQFNGANICGQEWRVIDKEDEEYLNTLFPGLNDTKGWGINLIMNLEKGVRPAVAPPHIDSYRAKFCANFIIQSGGDNVLTSWYIEKQRQHYENFFWGEDEVNYTPDIQKCFPTNKWYWMESWRPHSVENIEDVRIIISVSSTDDPWKILEMYGE